MTKILCGAPVRQTPATLAAHLKTLEWQELPSNVEMDYFFVDDCEDPEAMGLLPSSVPAPPSPPSGYEKTEATTLWTDQAFVRMAAMRQLILDEARERRYDYVFMSDSDLLLEPKTLKSLLATKKPIVSAVFWTAWQQGAPLLPQVWLNHPYVLNGRGLTEREFLAQLYSRQLTRVWGLGACTLISTAAVERGAVYSPLLDDLPQGGMWRGEDRSFCIRADRAHLELWADPWPRIFHVYRPSDEAKIEEALDGLQAKEPPSDRFGHWISATIAPLQEPNLAGWQHSLRGRLGAMNLVQPLEDALMEMPLDSPTIMRLPFPLDYAIEAYRGKTKTITLTLHDVRSHEDHLHS